MDLDHGKSSDEYHASQHVIRQNDTNVTLDNDVLKQVNCSKAEDETSCSSSTTSEDSSEEDFFQLDASQLDKSIAKLEEIGKNLVPSIQVENASLEAGLGFPNKHEVRNSSEDDEGKIAGSVLSSKTPAGSTASPGLFGGGSNAPILGVKQSPPVQSMPRPHVPDPKRIPSSVFARTKSNAPMEWSVASNESLFSIHTGKSGDLTGFYNNQFDNHPTPLTSLGQAQYGGIESGLQQQSFTGSMNAEANDDASRIAQVPFEKEKPSIEGMPHSDSTTRLSDSSVNSYRSFAFPILTTDGRNTSVKAELVHQEEKKKQPEPPPSTELATADTVAPQSKWFPCFSCCPFCC